MSPGSVTEKLHFFISEYGDTSSRTEGGGDARDEKKSKFQNSG
jgi:hypothetical protein